MKSVHGAAPDFDRMAAMRVLLTHGGRKPADAYLAALRGAGLEAVESTPPIQPGLAGCGGLVLAGGSDIEPSLYGQPNVAAKNPHPERDEMELRLIREALRLDLPIFGICRGAQMLNVAFGGTLLQEIGDKHTGVRHGVRFDPDSKAAAIAQPATVNSRHHQAVDRLGEGLRITGWSADDNVVEAIEAPERRFVIAVQWHPEDLAVEGDEEARALFAAFAAALH
jgi:putative glutamine amidotransferase